MRVIDILRAADEQVVAGVLYGGSPTVRKLTNSVFDGVIRPS
jgi:hypothetical protein